MTPNLPDTQKHVGFYLKTKEDFSELAGVTVNDILFTHKGISGPKIYEISSLKARENFPYKLSFDMIGEIDLQTKLNENPHKTIKNLLSDYVPKSFSEFVLTKLNILPETKCHDINGRRRPGRRSSHVRRSRFKRNKSKITRIKTLQKYLFLRRSS